jgi:carbon monoxide dehydrogenase subunit G
MSAVHVTIQIKAPPERVWETIMDPSRFSEWVTIHRSVSDVSRDPARQGAKMTQCLQIRGVSFKVHWTLAEADAPHVATWEGSGPARSQATTRYELTADGEDSTHFKYTNEFKTPGGVLGNMASRVIVGGVSEREAKNSLERLKRLLEGH